MYWQFNHQSSPQIETVLAKEDLTLSEVLDQENILQELKSPNTKLIEFITRSDILDELITLIIEEPSNELDEQDRYRRPNLACEVLTTDIPRLNESLSDISLLTKLYSFLEKDPPLNPLLASFFSRTLSLLVCRKSDQNWYSYQFTCLTVLDFLKSREDSLKLLLKHLGTSAIMDLTLKLITQVEGEAMQQNLVDWLEGEMLIESIIGLFHPNVESDRHCNAAQLLCDSIRKFREREVNVKENTKPDPMLDIIQSPETIKKLMETMLDNGEVCESSIAGGISVLLTLLEPPIPETPGRRDLYANEYSTASAAETNKPANPASSSIVLAIIPFLPKLHDLLINPPKKPPIRLACGIIDPPLGNTRLTVIKLIAALIATKTPEVNEKLDELNTVQVLLDLFFRYTWNNFLHSQVDKCLAFALNSAVADSKDQNPLISNIFIKCRLLQRILDAWEENEDEQSKGGKRKGYMGHLINITNSVLKQVSGNLADFLKEHVDQDTISRWEQHVENRLKPVNEVQSRFLGGSHPSQVAVKDELEFSALDSNTGGDRWNRSRGAGQLSAQGGSSWKNVVENFAGLFMGDREEREEDSNSPDYQVRKMMFEQMCSNRRLSADMEEAKDNWESEEGAKQDLTKAGRDLDFYLDDEEVWEDLPTSVWNNEDTRSSSEDEDGPIQEKMETMWSGPIADPTDPWGKGGNDGNGSNNDGWANFESADFNPPFSSFQSELPNPSESLSPLGDAQSPRKKDVVPPGETRINESTEDSTLRSHPQPAADAPLSVADIPQSAADTPQLVAETTPSAATPQSPVDASRSSADTPQSPTFTPKSPADTPQSSAASPEQTIDSETTSAPVVDETTNAADEPPTVVSAGGDDENWPSMKTGDESSSTTVINAGGDETTSVVSEPRSDNNANLKSLTDSPSPNKELYSRICSAKNKANEKIDDVPKSLEYTPIVNSSSDSTSQTAVIEEGSTKTNPPDPV